MNSTPTGLEATNAEASHVRKLKILMLVLWFDEVPGNWTFFSEIASRLASQGHEVVVISPHSGNPIGHGHIRVYRCSSIYLQQIPLYLISIPSFIATLKKVITKEGPLDLVYDTTSGLLPLSFMARVWFSLEGLKVPIFIHVHGELKDFRARGLPSLAFEIYLGIVARISYAVADKVLIAGEKIYRRVIELGAQPRKIVVVRVGIKYGEFPSRNDSQRDKQEIRSLRESLRLQERDFVIGYVGRLSRGKGVGKLLEAFAIARAEVADAKLVLVGEGGDRSYLQRLCKDLNISEDVRFLGQRGDVPELLSVMDVFANLSQSEAGISASQIEAMQMGLPSVVTPFSDFIEDMQDAMVVQWGDIKGTANALVRLHSDEQLRNALGHSAAVKAKKLRQLYSWDRYLAKMNSLFEGIEHHEVEK